MLRALASFAGVTSLFNPVHSDVENNDEDEPHLPGHMAAPDGAHNFRIPILPSLEPSWLPSSISGARPNSFKLDFDLGWDSGPVRSWYEAECAHGSTAVDKLQFRRDRLPPWYHGYVLLITRAGRTYRVDRRPDLNNADAPVDLQFIRNGSNALDTIELVDGAVELERIKSRSECVVELRYRNRLPKHSIYLLHVLSVCFAVREDELTKRYTLQRYNCYYLAWAIIMVSVRWMADWEMRWLLALSSIPGIEQDALPAPSKGAFYPRESWKSQLCKGWIEAYEAILGQDKQMDKNKRMCVQLLGMLQHILLRSIEKHSVTYPLMWLHPRNVLHEVGKALARSMPASFNYKLRTYTSDGRNADGKALLQELGDEGKRHLQLFIEEHRCLDPWYMLFLPSEFHAWMEFTFSDDEGLNLMVPHHLQASSIQHRALRARAQLTSSVPPEIYTEASSLLFHIPVIENEAEIYLSDSTTNTLVDLEHAMRADVTAYATRVAAWALARAREEVEEDVMYAMGRVWFTVLERFPRALVGRWPVS